MGSIASAIYCARNMDKVANGDVGRAGAASAQAINITNAASKSGIKGVNSVANSVFSATDDLAARYLKIGEASTKLTNIASKAVNPLLVAASGYRVLNDEDQGAALVEEGAAMTSMFAMEKLYKEMVSNPAAQKQLDESASIVYKVGADIQNATKNLKGWKKVAAKIAIDLGMVAASIVAFDAGKNVGKALTHRTEESSDTINQPTATNQLQYSS